METHIKNDPFLKPENVQGSEAWKQMRMNHIGASEAAAAIGECPYTTPLQLWKRKLGLAEPQEENYAMRRGTDMEPMARESFQKEHGVDVFPQVVYHSEHSFIMSSLDGLSIDGKTCVEIKCPGEKTHKMALEGKIPHHYKIQLQHQLSCLGIDKMFYYSFDGENGVSIEVHRNDEFIERMIEAEIKFWDCVQTKTSPPITDRDFVKKDSPVWNTITDRLLEIEEELVPYKSLLDEKESLRKALIAEASGNSCMGGGVRLTKSFPKGAIKYDKIPELEGVDLEKYRSPPKERWLMTLKKKEQLC